VPIEVNCSQCASLLRVADEHAGKKAKCPNCEAINEIPLASTTANNPENGVGYAGSNQPGNHPQAGTNPYSQGAHPHYHPQQFPGQPHRGGLVFALGIIGLLICQIPGIFAFFMGKEDLKKMKSGMMDPSGEGLTQAGMIMGLISLILLGIGLAVSVIYIIFIIVVVAGAGANGGF